MKTVDRSILNFQELAQKSCSFLLDIGYLVKESTPTLVRYVNGDIEVDIYHGRQSYEVGADVTVSGARYSLSEIVGASGGDDSVFRYASATTPEVVEKALDEIGSLLKRHGSSLLEGDLKFVDRLDQRKRKWSKNYALNVLADQVRPKAEEAFRRKDYSTAADLYSQIRETLNDTEVKKLDFSIRHSLPRG